jgi:hypothetical protein
MRFAFTGDHYLTTLKANKIPGFIILLREYPLPCHSSVNMFQLATIEGRHLWSTPEIRARNNRGSCVFFVSALTSHNSKSKSRDMFSVSLARAPMDYLDSDHVMCFL